MKNNLVKIIFCSTFFLVTGFFWREKGITIIDARGNKNFFTKESVTCYGIGKNDIILACTGSAVRTDVAGYKYAIEFDEKWCAGMFTTQAAQTSTICKAAEKLEKIHPSWYSGSKKIEMNLGGE